MGTVRFVLRTDKPDKAGLSPIQLVYQLSGERKYFKTKQKLLPYNWDTDKQLAIMYDKQVAEKHPTKKEAEKLLSKREVQEVNSNLEGLIKEIIDLENLYRLNKVPYSPQMVIDSLKEARLPETKKDATSKQLYFFIDKYVADHKNTRKKTSLAIYTSLKNHLQQYQAVTKKEVTFENMDYGFFQGFQNFLIDKQNLSNTTVAKQLSTIKTFINYARMQGVTVTDKYKDFKIKKENLEVIALTSEEFETLFTLDLSGNQRMAEVRDIFCFSCATGLRYSDLAQLEWMHIAKDEIRLKIIKTEDHLSIPLNPFSQAILEKYRATPRPLPAHLVRGKLQMLSNQKLNQAINGMDDVDAAGRPKHHKGLCELAGIDQPVELVRFRGAKRESVIYPKYELISIHTGRKTFATLSLEKGMSAEEVMTITGHSDYKSFKRYVKVTDQRKKVVMAKAWGAVKPSALKAV